MTMTKERLHKLVDSLPEAEVHAAERYLQYLNDIGADSLLRAIAEAPYDDEDETEEERAAVGRAREQRARGEVKSIEQVRRELGL